MSLIVVEGKGTMLVWSQSDFDWEMI